MEIINVQQGGAEWLAVRAKYFTASEAAAAMGLSRYMTRDQLLRQKSSGILEEVDAQKQRLFDQGHASEAAARPIVEARIGCELFPCTATLEVDGLPLLASLDGLPMDETVVWENKLMNTALLDAILAGEVPDTHWPQLEQGLLVTGAEKAYFTVSDGTEEGTVGMWYQSRAERRAKLIAAWKQFAKDLQTYQPLEVVPETVAAPQMALPALAIQVNGSITLTDNLTIFGDRLKSYVEAINKKPKTDQDFADLESTVKTLKAAEEALDAAESNALGQTASIDEMRRTVGLYRDLARQNRLVVEKLVKAEKENRRNAIIQVGKETLAERVAAMNDSIGIACVSVAADFAGKVKGLKSIASIQSAVNDELARATIEANGIADRVRVNLRVLEQLADKSLFPDLATVCTKDSQDFAMLIAFRVGQQKEADENRLEAERARIRAEEEARAAVKVKAEQDEAAEKIKQDAALTAKDNSAANTLPIPPAKRPTDDEIITALALHFRVHESKVIEWLLDMALDGATERMCGEFA